VARPPLPDRPLVTTLTCTYQRPAFLRNALEVLRRQTYRHLEIIVVNNGNPPTSETVEYLRWVKTQDPRIIVIDYAENQFSVDDPQKMLDCLNGAMSDVATGDLVFVMDDDNFITDDYVEKMVALFTDNPECTTASGLPVQVDVDGRLLPGTIEHSRAHNRRSRFTPGHLLAMDFFLNDIPTLWMASCFSFTIRRDEYIAAGGIQRGEHYASLFGVVPFGISGFDETALLYNRVHERQLNRALIELGNIGNHFVVDALTKMNVEARWREYCGDDVASRVISAVKQRAFVKMKRHADQMLRRGRLEEALRQYGHCLVTDPHAADIHRKIGDASMVAGRPEDAARSYEEALRLTGGTAALYARLAAAHYQRGRLADAIANLERAVAVEPEIAGSHRKLGWLLLRDGQPGRALHAWIDAMLAAVDAAIYSALLRRAWARRFAYRAALTARKAATRLRRVAGGGGR
jgi:Tfp pilus assembly protein PilF